MILLKKSQKTQTVFEFANDLEYGHEAWAPGRRDDLGLYLPCYECEKHVRYEDIDNDTYSKTQPTDEHIRGEYLSEDELNLIKNVFYKLKNELPERLIKESESIIKKHRDINIYAAYLKGSYEKMVSETFREITNILQKHKSSIDVPMANSALDSLKGILSGTQTCEYPPYGASAETLAAKYKEDTDKLLKIVKERSLLIPDLVDKLYLIVSKPFDKPTFKHKVVNYKYPICDDCVDEKLICCDEEGCEECSIDEDDFYEVEQSKWNNETRKNEKKTLFFCKEEDHGVKCSSCGNGAQASDDETRNYQNEYYHDECFNELYSYCEGCHDTFYREDMIWDEANDKELCRNCFDENNERNKGSDESIDKEKFNEYIESSAFKAKYPLDPGIIEGNILPVLRNADKSFEEWDDKAINWIMKRIQKPEAKAAVSAEIEQNGKGALEAFESNLNYVSEFKNKYPSLKGYRPIPVSLEAEKSAMGHEGTVLAIYPNDATFAWANKITPLAEYVYEKYLSRKGHHRGALGYVRLSQSNGNIIVDNLQTDIDKQSAIKLEEDDFPGGKDKGGHSKGDVDAALNWWYKSIDKFYAPFLLDAVRNFALSNEQKAYVTPFEMQQEKWRRIPDRNKDVYDKLPEMMGMRAEKVKAKPEDLVEKNWDMWRVARQIDLLLDGFCKDASTKKKRKKSKKKDESCQVRHWPNRIDAIKTNYDLGEGPYSQSDGKPYNAKGQKAASVYDYIDKLSHSFHKKVIDG